MIDATRTAALFLLFAGLVSCRRDPKGGPSTSPLVDLGLGDLFGSAVRGPQVVADEEISLAAHAWRGPGFTLPSPRVVRVVADGKKHTEKGFKVYVMAQNEVANFEKRKPFRDVPSFEGVKVRSFDKTETLPAGSWRVVVHNSENILQTMVVHLRVAVDPA